MSQPDFTSDFPHARRKVPGAAAEIVEWGDRAETEDEEGGLLHGCPVRETDDKHRRYEGESARDQEPSSATFSEDPLDLDATLDLSSGMLRRHSDQLRSQGEPSDGQTTSEDGLPSSGGLITTPTFRPTQRPPAAVLQVFDDSQERAELVRIRRTPFDIGRQEGDLTVPHELQMSRRHARIDRRQVNGQWQWHLRDLGSTNGTFVRARRVRLRDKDELLLGADLVRFLQPDGPETAVLLKVAPTKYEEKVVLRPGTLWIGTSSECLPLLQTSKFLDPQHLKLELDEHGQWRLFDCGSTNHVWVRIEEVRLADGCCFQAGEQRFSFHLP